MADSKITQLTNATSLADSDLLTFVDVDDTTLSASGTNKKVTLQVLRDSLQNVEYTNVVHVAKHGDDSNSGTNPDTPLLTLNAAETKAESLTTGSNRVLIKILDTGTYSTGNLTLEENIDLWGEYATLEARLVIRSDSNVKLFKLYDDGSAFPTINKNSGDLNAYVHINEIDGRGVNGTVTGGFVIRNEGGGGVLVIRTDKIFIAEDQIGVGDQTGGFGHIHLECEDLYLAGDNAVGIEGNNNDALITARIGQILDLGTVANTTAISLPLSGDRVQVSTNEIKADTAYNIASGAELILYCGNLEGTQTGTPTALFSNVKTITETLNLSNLPTSASGLSSGDVWNDGGTLKIV
jgi:hypothetical protein